jgi:hypothetical protein
MKRVPEKEVLSFCNIQVPGILFNGGVAEFGSCDSQLMVAEGIDRHNLV